MSKKRKRRYEYEVELEDTHLNNYSSFPATEESSSEEDKAYSKGLRGIVRIYRWLRGAPKRRDE
jgi:hypothetical protein